MAGRLPQAVPAEPAVTQKADLNLEVVDDHPMGLEFEELISRFAEISNEAASEHFPPREVIRLMVSLTCTEGDAILAKPGVVRTGYDHPAGTGCMLSNAPIGMEWKQCGN